MLLIGSLAVLFYSQVLDEAIAGWKDLVTLCAIGGQWGTPLGVYLSATVTATTLLDLLTLFGHMLHVFAAVGVSIAYLRHRTEVTTTRTEAA
ncbi:hypothetical protein C497_02167 [Halalkalicoccus jeotgali B3]|uniref:Uncharacterized protein n=1 Tax=Halalkalicoccus jeotgali (strain DSM 18796 / CECT 7217 / JCM 14584 / KCTC 4019 / B3) TaxID=795797 RepID=L9VUH6_HALJB|nr:hypothetical protein C497_02167 [Halalkalicoccus jeotgali B3]